MILRSDSRVSGNLCIWIVCKPGDDAGKGKSRDFPREEEEEKEEEVKEEERVVLHTFLTQEENFLRRTLINLHLRTLQGKERRARWQMMLTQQICPLTPIQRWNPAFFPFVSPLPPRHRAAEWFNCRGQSKLEQDSELGFSLSEQALRSTSPLPLSNTNTQTQKYKYKELGFSLSKWAPRSTSPPKAFSPPLHCATSHCHSKRGKRGTECLLWSWRKSSYKDK